MPQGLSDEQKLQSFIEGVTKGVVTSIEAQPRWRRAWYVDVLVDGSNKRVYVRGERGGDVMPFPDLRREMAILQELAAQGILVPHIYGYCDDPVAIVMEAVPGTRDISKAESDEERRDIARQYIAQLAKMHAAPIQGFISRGIDLPANPEAIAFAGLNAYLPLYERVKCKPEPLIEFAYNWIKRNPPLHRTRPSFIQFDAGQFLFEQGRLTTLYDLEFAMIGDPMADLASMRMRESVEPYGEELRVLLRHYEQCSGTKIDDESLLFHNIVFATVSIMQFCGAIAKPTAGDPHDVYLLFDLALRNTLIEGMSEALGIVVEPPRPPVASERRWPALTMLSDAIEQIPVGNDIQDMKRGATKNLAEFILATLEFGPDAEAQTLVEAEAILGCRFNDIASMEAALEGYVQDAEPQDDEKLLRFFHREVSRNIAVYSKTQIGQAALSTFLSPIR